MTEGLPMAVVRVWVSFMVSIKDYLLKNNPEALSWDELKEAIVGVGQQYRKPPVLIYSKRKIIEIVMKRGLTFNEAVNYYESDINCRWFSIEENPIIMDDLSVSLEEKNQEHEATDTFIKGETHALTPRSRQGGCSHPTGKDVPRIQSRVRSTHHRRN